MKFKQGVSIEGVKKATIEAMFKVANWYSKEGLPFVVTSVTDGKHKTKSKHYTGEAFDVRTWTTRSGGVQLTQGRKREIAYELGKLLGDNFDIVVEKTHIHIEYDPS